MHYMVLLVNAANREKTEVLDDGKVVKKTIHVGGEKDDMGFTEEEKFQDLFELTGMHFTLSNFEIRHDVVSGKLHASSRVKVRS